MIFLFEIALLATMIAVLLKTDIHPGALACLYLIGWMTPWIIPRALSSEFSWLTLAIPAAVFLSSWLLLWTIRRLRGSACLWPVAALGTVLIAALF